MNKGKIMAYRPTIGLNTGCAGSVNSLDYISRLLLIFIVRRDEGTTYIVVVPGNDVEGFSMLILDP